MSTFETPITQVTGPMLLATMINCGLHGVFCVQVHTYYMAFPNDRMAFKILVHGCFIMETLQTLLIIRDGFDIFVTHLGDPLSIDLARLYWLSTTVIGGVVVTIGQLFFAYRLRTISNSWILPVSASFLSVCATVAQLTIAAHVYSSGRISSVFTGALAPTLVSFATNIVCDIVIIVSIVYYLSRHRPISSPRLHRQVKHLVRLIIETGALTATVNILSFILYILFKGSTYFVVPYAMASKLYSNTMVMILNNRLTIRGGRDDVDEGNGIALWNVNMTPIHSRPNRGDPPSPTNDTLVIREVWRNGSDDLDVAYAPNESTANNVATCRRDT